MRQKERYRIPTDSETAQLIFRISELINDGYSIVLARKIVCGGTNNRFTRAILKNDLYVHVLNSYLKTRGYYMRYKKEGLILKQIKTKQITQ